MPCGPQGRTPSLAVTSAVASDNFVDALSRGLLDCKLQSATAAATLDRPWAEDAVVAIVRGGLGSLRLAHAKSTAQEALPCTGHPAQPDSRKPYTARQCGADILADVAQGLLTPPVLRNLAKQGLVPDLLQVGSSYTAGSSNALLRHGMMTAFALVDQPNMATDNGCRHYPAG